MSVIVMDDEDGKYKLICDVDWSIPRHIYALIGSPDFPGDCGIYGIHVAPRGPVR